jgi:hypothetical protein
MAKRLQKAFLHKIRDLAPVTYIAPLNGPLAVSLEHYAAEEGYNAETIIAEAVRAYLGDTVQ